MTSRRRTNDSLINALVGVLLVAVVGAGIWLWVEIDNPRRTSEPTATAGQDTEEAPATGEPEAPTSQAPEEPVVLTPDPLEAADDVADVYDDGCHQGRSSVEAVPCVYGDADGDLSVALVGDSHAAHWQPTLRAIAEAEGWSLETYTKSTCPLADAPVLLDGQPYPECFEWSSAVVERLTAEPPDVIFLSSTHYKPADEQQDMSGAYARSWRALRDAGSEVAVVVDTPRFAVDLPECVVSTDDYMAHCGSARDAAVDRSGASQQLTAIELVPDVAVVDMTDALCPDSTCNPVVDGMLTMYNAHSLTATFARSLADAFLAEVQVLDAV